MDSGNDGDLEKNINCAPGFSECARKVSGLKCPGGNKCISKRLVTGASLEKAMMFHQNHSAARDYLGERRVRRAKAGEEKTARHNALMAAKKAGHPSTATQQA